MSRSSFALGAVALGLMVPASAQASPRSAAIDGALRAVRSHEGAVHAGAGQAFSARTVILDR